MNEQRNTAIVTGGTGSLGRVLTRTLLERGYRVAVPFRDRAKAAFLEKAYAETKDLLLAEADISREEAVASFTNTVLGRFGSVALLMHAAGGYLGGALLEETTPGDWDAMISGNLRSAYLMCRALVPHMRRQGFGRILTVTAMPALKPSARRSAYAVAKGGIVTLTEALAEEVRGSGITVNAIAPSIIVTEENRKSMPDADTSAWVTPDEIARLMLFLASDDARSINGSIVKMFGGF